MSANQKTIPLSAARLLIGFCTNTNSETENTELDEWISATDENMQIFEACLELTFRQKQPDPQTEDEYELSIVAELIIKRRKKTITREENKSLRCWINASKVNRELFNNLPQTEDIGVVYYWLVNQYNIVQL